MAKVIDKKALDRYDQLCKDIKRYSTINPFEKPEEKKVRIAEAKRDFRFFVKHYFAHYTESETPEFHVEFAKMVARDPHIKVWMKWARGHAKSVLADVMIPLWLWIKKDIEFMLVIGQNETKASILTGDLQAEFEHNERLIHDFGKQQLQGHWETGFFQTKNGFIVKAFGLGQDPRGIRVGNRRPDYISGDDWEDRFSVKNHAYQDEMANWLRASVVPAMGAKNTRVLLAQNHWSPRMIFSQIIEQSPKKWKVHQVNAYDPVTYKSTWPDRFPHGYFRDKEEELTIIICRAEYNNEPHIEGKMFLDEYMNYGKRPKLHHFDAIVGRWDVAFAGTKKSDYNAVRIWGQKDGRKWLIDCFVKQCKVKMAIEWIAQFQKQSERHYGIQVGFEAQFWNESILSTIVEVEREKKMKLNLIKIDRRQGISKYDDIVSTLTDYQNGKVWFDEKLKGLQDHQVGLAQIKGIEPGYKTKDDAPDADTYAFHELDKFGSLLKTKSRMSKPRENRKY